ncbi:MAG: hypothetical protein ABEJ94_06115 [Halorientalis sp.]
MNWPSPGDFREVRRALPVIAAGLFVAALLFPMWIIEVHAVQYPDTTLVVKLFAYPHLSGDYHEMYMLNKYVGFHYPDPVLWDPNYPVREGAIKVPEWSLGPIAFIAVAALSLFVAVAPTTEKLKRGIKWQLIGTVTVFGVMLADIQYRLYQAGHTLDPGAPVMGVSGFTPPIWGKYTVANITSYSYLGPGAGMAMLAVFLLVCAFYYRDTPVTFVDLPRRGLARVGLFDSDDESTTRTTSTDAERHVTEET